MPTNSIRLACSRLIIVLMLAFIGCGERRPVQASYTVRPEHPRIWLNPQILASLRAKAAAGSPRWQSVKTACDTYFQSSNEYDVSVMNYALAYQVTGNTAYADKAIALMQGIADGGLPALMWNSGLNVRLILPPLAIGYDWCYDRMTPAQRNSIRAAMEQFADWVWTETNPSRVGQWSLTNPGDNYYHGFMMTWLVGLALHGDSPKAPGYIDQAVRRWKEEARPYLEQYAAGGYSLEGTNYGTETYFRIFWYLAAHQSAAGEDLLNAPGFAWSKAVIRAKIHQTTPTRDLMYPNGDQPRDHRATLSDYARSSALVAAAYMDQETAGLAKGWLDRIIPDRNKWRWELWQEFLWHRDDLAGTDYTQTFPTGYLAPGSGWMTSRSSWLDDAVQVHMMCGPTLESHQDLAQNDFMIFRGDWLAAKARLKSNDGLRRETEYHNTILIGGKGQPETQPELPKERPSVVHFEETPRYAYFAGQAADGYAYYKWPAAIPVLNSFLRQLVFLKPNKVVVFDHVDALDGSQVKKWLLHTLNDPTVTTDTYRATAGGRALLGKSLLPTGATIQKVPLSIGPGNSLSSWRIEIAAPIGKKLDHFLNVLEVAPTDQATASPAATLVTSRAGLVGVRTGNQVLVFDTVENPTLPFSYQVEQGLAGEHFVLNQDPKEWHLITEKDQAGATLRQQAVLTTAEGVLVFSATSPGLRTVEINSYGGVPPTEIPPAPTNLTAKVSALKEITLTWTDNGINETNFAIWRKVGGGAFARHSGVPTNVTTFVDRNLTPGITYSYQVRSNSSTATGDWSNIASATPPVPAVMPPSVLKALVNSSQEITLTWTDNSTNEVNFAVWCKEGSGAFLRKSGTQANITTFVDRNLKPGTTYSYQVRANSSTASSDWSNFATATTLPKLVNPPSNLVAKATSAKQILLTWRDNSSDEANFAIWRKVGNGTFNRLGGTVANVAAYVDRNLTPLTTYSYQVRANSTTAISNWSGVASATTRPLSPSAPSNLKATILPTKQIQLNWTDNAYNETGFSIWRKKGTGAFIYHSARPANAVTFIEMNPTPGTAYVYQVRADNTGGSSAFSNTASVTTGQ